MMKRASITFFVGFVYLVYCSEDGKRAISNFDGSLTQAVLLGWINSSDVANDFLDLGNLNIKSIAPNTFAGLNCTGINLKDNLISIVGVNSFAGLSQLEVLDLSSNSIAILDGYAFIDLANLTVLNLQSNKIAALDNMLFRSLTNLKKLNLRSNQISLLAGGLFDSLTKLEELYMGYNRIQSIDPSIFANVISLKKLFLNANQMQSFGTFNASLGNLKVLNLASNQITTIDTSALSSLSLEELDMSYNKIGPNLTLAELNNLVGLKQLNLRNNAISELAAQTRPLQLKNVIRLDLSFNKIEKLESYSFSGLIGLKYLDLNNNLIKTMSTKTFTGLQSIERLDLSRNKLGFLSKFQYEGLWQLDNSGFIVENQIKSSASSNSGLNLGYFMLCFPFIYKNL
jgi:Leucine-rich repeat (LRR) protein